jgi:hypothetical protein
MSTMCARIHEHVARAASTVDTLTEICKKHSFERIINTKLCCADLKPFLDTIHVEKLSKQQTFSRPNMGRCVAEYKIRQDKSKMKIYDSNVMVCMLVLLVIPGAWIQYVHR